MQRSLSNTMHRHATGEMALREAVLLTFCTPAISPCAYLEKLSSPEWRRLLRWLDISGLALYFLDRLTVLNQTELLPTEVLARLQQNLADNTTRTETMIEESAAIHRTFQRAGLLYVALKGFSLWPISVPRPELRSQLDLDFLVAKKDASEARRILELRGYHLRAISGRSWEFKANEAPGMNLKELYKDRPFRSVELHLDPDSANSVLLARAQLKPFRGITMPVLSPADLFLGQGLHLFKHICSEFSRAAHLIEFHRHVIARHDDETFWRTLPAIAETNAFAPFALGVVNLLIQSVMGDFAPAEFTCWTVDRLSHGARQWVQLYGRRATIGNHPGTKLYLLLQRELIKAGLPAKRSVRRSLLPTRLPPLVVHGYPHEALFTRVWRYWAQFRFIFFRLRFHAVEGLRYLCESVRWSWHMRESPQ
jgi:hypothetical protein